MGLDQRFYIGLTIGKDKAKPKLLKFVKNPKIVDLANDFEFTDFIKEAISLYNEQNHTEYKHEMYDLSPAMFADSLTQVVTHNTVFFPQTSETQILIAETETDQIEFQHDSALQHFFQENCPANEELTKQDDYCHSYVVDNQEFNNKFVEYLKETNDVYTLEDYRNKLLPRSKKLNEQLTIIEAHVLYEGWY